MTRAVILAAGEGTRLRPLTDHLPKTLVPLAGTPLLNRQLRVLQQAGIEDISIVTGYHAQTLAGAGLRVFTNPRYASTNMVASLLCARALFDGTDDVIVAYGDIVYEPKVLASVMQSDAPLSVVVDLNWLALWSLRMDNPLDDAETLKLDANGNIIELGAKPDSIADIQGQYIGLYKVDRKFAPSFLSDFELMHPEAELDGKPRDRIFMTSYLQYLIDHGVQARAACIEGGWIEVDSVDDLQRYETALAEGRLKPICNLDA